jgi:hypothetical protein
MGWNT